MWSFSSTPSSFHLMLHFNMAATGRLQVQRAQHWMYSRILVFLVFHFLWFVFSSLHTEPHSYEKRDGTSVSLIF